MPLTLLSHVQVSKPKGILRKTGNQKKQVLEISNILRNKQVLYFKQVSVTRKKILNRKNKKKTGTKQLSEPPGLLCQF